MEDTLETVRSAMRFTLGIGNLLILGRLGRVNVVEAVAVPYHCGDPTIDF